MRMGRLIRCGLVTGRKGIARVLDSARLAPLDWVSLGVFALGLLMVATGLLPLGDASHTLRRILPLVGFLAAVIVLAELTAEAQLFDIVATRLAIIARGSFAAMFALCVIFAATATAALNLDTTAVLLTPVMLAVAGPADIPPVPLAMTTVWLANTASLLLPVSNLTNLLAMNRLALTAPGFASRMYLPELASVAATVVCLWIMYWRRGLRPSDRYRVPEPYEPPRSAAHRSVSGGMHALRRAGAAVGAAGRRCAERCLHRHRRIRRALEKLTEPALDSVAVAHVRDRAVPCHPGHRPARARGDPQFRGWPRPGGPWRVARGRPGCRAVQRRQQPARVRRGRGGDWRGEPRSASRPAHRDERRPAGGTVGIAGHDALVCAVPGERTGDLLAAFRWHRSDNGHRVPGRGDRCLAADPLACGRGAGRPARPGAPSREAAVGGDGPWRADRLPSR